MNSQDVALTPECEECGTVWLPNDAERWRAERIDDGAEDRLIFYLRRVGDRPRRSLVKQRFRS